MSAEEYRQRAHECFLAAAIVADPGAKIWLLEMAQSWLVLAHQAEKNLDADRVRDPDHATPRSHAEPVMQQQQQVQPKKEPGSKNE